MMAFMRLLIGLVVLTHSLFHVVAGYLVFGVSTWYSILGLVLIVVLASIVQFWVMAPTKTKIETFRHPTTYHPIHKVV